jgi:hypothetical protein
MEGWTDAGVKDGVHCWRKAAGALFSMRGDGEMKASLVDLQTFMKKPERFVEFDKILIKATALETQEDPDGLYLAILYSHYSSPASLIVSERDFVVFCAMRLLPEGLVYAIESIEHPAKPPVKGLVRGAVHDMGSYTREVRPGVLLQTYIAQVDPKGSLPAFVVNWAAASQPMNVAELRKILEKDAAKASK